ncbi:hypothetical protein GJ744_007707 [Endocarpon pusillum]|uniref:Uncharacterized protein n=1 Tax=Endocarpon pusillum TaxID=364733 RepID=A0A8H7EBD0_9EURO|nr:hypothetical protein GJ744_007707 [Endocarpon pusillum]
MFSRRVIPISGDHSVVYIINLGSSSDLGLAPWAGEPVIDLRPVLYERNANSGGHGYVIYYEDLRKGGEIDWQQDYYFLYYEKYQTKTVQCSLITTVVDPTHKTRVRSTIHSPVPFTAPA